MQYITNSYLPSTLHKVGLNTSERFSFAYFHEPNFSAVMKPLPGFNVGQESTEGIHYGTHFTNMFMRNYPKRITTQRMKAENRLALLNSRALRWPEAVLSGAGLFLQNQSTALYNRDDRKSTLAAGTQDIGI